MWSLMRCQKYNMPEDLHMIQHAMLKGLSCLHLTRLTYTSVFVQLRRFGEILLMFLDLSNRYGHTDRDLVSKQVAQGSNLQWDWKQQRQLYARTTVYVLTAVGLSMAYSIHVGLVQGGGMDPYFYIWNSMFLAGPGVGGGGIQIPLWNETIRLHIQCVVDDTTVWAPTQGEMRNTMHSTLGVLHAMNAQCNVDKFGLLHYTYDRHKIHPKHTTLEVEGTKVRAASRAQYVKLLGGDANVLATGAEDMACIRKQARHITAQMCRHVPSLDIIQAILVGCILARWLYKRSVVWPDRVEQDTHEGETKTVRGIMCNNARRVLYLPLKTPKQFFVHTKGIAVEPPLHKFWETIMQELYRAANARHAWVRESTKKAILHPWSGNGTLKGVDTDYDKVYRWCKQKGWQPRVHHEGAETDTWECKARQRGEHRSSLVVVADVSGKQEGTTWGLGAVVATVQSEVLWEAEAWMEVMHGSIEATAVVEACRALVCALQEHMHTCLIMAFCDNKAAATALAHRKLTHRGGSHMDRTVCSFQELGEQKPILMGWCPAQHDTRLQGTLALLNKRADATAKRARTHKRGKRWHMPKAWSEGHTFAWYKNGQRIMGVKQAVRASMPHVNASAPSEQEHVPMAHIIHAQEDKHLRRLWTRCTFRHPREQAGALLAGFYENTQDMYIAEEGQGTCDVCGVPYTCRI